MKKLTSILTLMAVAMASTVALGTAADAATSCPSTSPRVVRDVAYVDHPVSPLQRLDIYTPARRCPCEPAPVVIWVHGGGWTKGDKRQVKDKPAFFNSLGYVFVSVGYRLSAPFGAPNRPMHPDHANDVGAAVAWVEQHIDRYGGDGSQLALLGHSAGAHLVALVGSDTQYIEQAGGTFSSLRCVGSFDTESYDLLYRRTTPHGNIVPNAFGTDESVLRDASPINHLDDAERLPDFQIVERGSAERTAAEQRFVDAVRAAGGRADVIDAHGLTHGQVNELIGDPSDTVMTPKVRAFVTSCLG